MVMVMHTLLVWFLHVTGADNTSGVQYGFWSGFGSDFGEVALVGSLIALWHHLECHIDGCHRPGRFPFHHYKLCRKHHPAVPTHVTHFHIKQLHKEEQRDGKVQE